MSASINTLPQIIDNFVKQTGSVIENVVWWCGSGIGAASGLPLGNDLTEKALDVFGSSSLLKELEGIYSLAQVLGQTDKNYPRLESVYQEILNIYGEDALDHLGFFSTKRSPVKITPNEIHKFLSQRLNYGDWVFTTNFDDLIEEAWRTSYPSKPLRVYVFPDQIPKLGNVNDPSGLVKIHHCASANPRHLGITLDRVNYSPTLAMWQRLSALLSKPTVLFVVLGYSGLDTMDVVPLFTMNGKHHWKSKMLWIDHDNNAAQNVSTDLPRYESAKRMIDSFMNNHAVCIRADTNHVLNLPRTNSQCNWQAHVYFKINQTIPEFEQALFSTKYFASLGYTIGARRELERIKYLIEQGMAILNEHQKEEFEIIELNTVRDEGRYKDELKLRTRRLSIVRKMARAGLRDKMDILWAELERAATLRLRGNYLRAWYIFWRITRRTETWENELLALNALVPGDKHASIPMRAHMEYLYLTGILSEIPLIKKIFLGKNGIAKKQVDRALFFLQFSDSLRGYAMVYRVAIRLGVQIDSSRVGNTEEWFKDMESFLGIVNSSRDSIAKGIKEHRHQKYTIVELQLLHDKILKNKQLALQIGDMPGYFKAVLLEANVCRMLLNHPDTSVQQKKNYSKDYRFLRKNGKRGCFQQVQTSFLGKLHFFVRYISGR